MEELKSSPLFHKIDQAIFDRIDKFKLSPGYNPIQDFYNALEEEQQKLFKGFIILMTFVIPMFILGFIAWQNNNLKEDLALRKSVVSKANEIIGQSAGLQQVAPEVFSSNPIESESMMTSKISELMSSMSIDLSKIQISDFNSESVSSTSMKSTAKFTFTNVTTEELMNIFTLLISREKFRIVDVEIKRNPDTSMLAGNFHGIHYSTFTPKAEGEE